MGLEQVPTCPEGIKHGSEDYVEWLKSLSVENQANVFVGWTKKDIDFLLTLPNIDQARAIRGAIVADLGGDSLGHLLSTIQYGEYLPKESLANGLELTWLEMTKTVETFGKFLPEQCATAYKDIFDKYHDFVSNTLSLPKQINFEQFNFTGRNLFDDIKLIFYNPPGMDSSDIEYTRNILTENRNLISQS